MQINPEIDETSRSYLKWRANLVSKTIASLAEYSRSIRPDIIICANDYDVIMHPTYISHGIDLKGLADCQDLVMIENFALPRSETGILINNAITIRTTLALVNDTPVTTNPYDKGIGFDNVFSPHRIQQGIAEAAALGTALVVKGTEFVDKDGKFTLLTAKKYASQRYAAGLCNKWLAENSKIYQDRVNIAKIGLLYPEDGFKSHWDQTAKCFFGICQTLTVNGIPWRVITKNNPWDGLELIFTFEKTDYGDSKVRLIYVPNLKGWEAPEPTLLAKYPIIRNFTSGLLGWFFRSYFKYSLVRGILDKLKIPQWFLGSPYFRIPSKETQDPVLDIIHRIKEPRVIGTEAPVLIDNWQNKDHKQVHLVNYGSESQMVTVRFAEQVRGNIYKLGEKEVDTFHGEKLELRLVIYAVITYK